MSLSAPSWKIRLLALGLILGAHAPLARAQAPNNADDDDDDDSPPAAMVNVQRFATVNFDQWVFQNAGNQIEARKRMEQSLVTRLESLDRTCALTDEQKAKLQLMGRGEIKHFYDHYEKIKRKFELIKDDQQKVQEIWKDIQPLQLALQGGLFDEGTMLTRSLPHILKPEQMVRYDSTVRERRLFLHLANIEIAVAMLERITPLRAQQRKDLINLLTSTIKPWRIVNPNYSYFVTMIQISRVPEEKLKLVFDNVQWNAVNQQLNQIKGNELRFKQMGVLLEDYDETDLAPGPKK